jgi:DNA-binding response OmpR family regulator
MVPQNESVLVIEGDPNERRMMEDVLIHFGLDVRTAGTAAEAAERLRSCPPCVLIDAELPDDHGKRIFQWLQLNKPQIKVALMTNRDEATGRGRGELKPNAIFRKPVDALELIPWIRSFPTNQLGYGPQITG